MTYEKLKERRVLMDNKNLQITNHDFLIYRDSNNDIKVSVMLINNDIWLTQNLIAELFGVGRSTITEHINNILNSGELDEKNTVGKTDVDNSKKPVKIYNLDMIIAVGYRVNSKKATNFRIWATKILKEYMIKGVVMDDERLKILITYLARIILKKYLKELGIFVQVREDFIKNNRYIFFL